MTSGTGCTAVDVGGYCLRLDRLYDPRTHLWVMPAPDGRLGIGLDALAVASCGEVERLEVAKVGTMLERGVAFGWLDAATFGGALSAPVSGVLAAVNPLLHADPALAAAPTTPRYTPGPRPHRSCASRTTGDG
jgi:glycine cleavage system H protein